MDAYFVRKAKRDARVRQKTLAEIKKIHCRPIAARKIAPSNGGVLKPKIILPETITWNKGKGKGAFRKYRFEKFCRRDGKYRWFTRRIRIGEKPRNEIGEEVERIELWRKIAPQRNFARLLTEAGGRKYHLEDSLFK
jgi:hypothetical protein